MRDKDRSQLRALGFMLGVADAQGEPLPKDILDRHDWSKFLLAKEMDPNTHSGPSWVPFSLWQAYEYGSDPQLKEIARTLIYSPGAEELWATIERSYDRPNNMTTSLPMTIREAFEHWIRISKATPSDHRKLMTRLRNHARVLSVEIERINVLKEFLTGEHLDFMGLHTEEERLQIYARVRLHNLYLRKTAEIEQEGKSLGYRMGDVAGRVTKEDWDEYNRPKEDPDSPESPVNHSVASSEAHETWRLIHGDPADGLPGIVPPLPELFQRLAAELDAMAKVPALQRPSHANAKRNFVARQLGQYFKNSAGPASPSLIAKIVSMFFPQGISENEVSQMLAKLPEPDWEA